MVGGNTSIYSFSWYRRSWQYFKSLFFNTEAWQRLGGPAGLRPSLRLTADSSPSLPLPHSRSPPVSVCVCLYVRLCVCMYVSSPLHSYALLFFQRILFFFFARDRDIRLPPPAFFPSTFSLPLYLKTRFNKTIISLDMNFPSGFYEFNVASHISFVSY